ncbi:MAG: glycoside hydrolase family 20 zincin-like fold domain-containing protein [Lachnospiraceae bacterium]|nr:glycoside hydrolase family 20 zincin-like fold domain-containing protein [Lachnospiraceae bacterium]
MYLIPKPQQWAKKDGIFILEYDRRIVIHPSCGTEVFRYAKMLKDDLVRYAGYGLDITRGSSKKTAVKLAVSHELPEESYRLNVSGQGIELTGGSDTGVLYGIQTLRQMIRQEGACIPCLSIFDYPDTAVRGLHYDVTRGRVPTMEYLKRLVDQMALYKMNQLQLYIEHSFLFEDCSEVWRDDTPLTAEELLELDTYCRERKIDLVPSLACFGHLYKTLRTKTYRHLCEFPDMAEQPFGFVDRMEHHTLDVSNEESLRFAKKRIEEYMPLFSSKYFNICADETFDLGKGRSRELAEQKGVKQLYLDFLRQLCDFVKEKGKIPMFWGDVIWSFPEIAAELPRGTVCLNWGYERDQTDDTVRRLAEAGAVQYCCPGVSGWDQLVNRLDVAYENIRLMCSYAAKYRAAGVLNTDWGDCGHINHPEFSTAGIIYGAAFTWNQEVPSFEEINRQISVLEYQDASGQLVGIIAEISKHWIYKWRDLVNYMEHRDTAFKPPERFAKLQEETEALEAIKRKLYRILPCLGTETRAQIKPYLMAIEGMELVQEAGAVFSERWMEEKAVSGEERIEEKAVFVGKRPEEETVSGEKQTEKKTVSGEKRTEERADRLAARLEEWFYQYKKIWRSVSRESELYRVQDVIFWCDDYLRRGLLPK